MDTKLFVALFPVAAILAAGSAHGADEEVTFRGSASWINAYTHNQILNVDRDPDGEALAIPSDRLTSELRPNFKFVTNNLQLVARPRLSIYADEIQSKDPETGKDRSKFFQSSHQFVWSETFAQWTMSDAATMAIGRQNFQWGAAEALNPSNRLFHETVQARSEIYQVTGHNVARLNLSLGKAWSTILMTEYEENKDIQPFVYGQKFQSAGLIKNEVNWNSGADYFGVVFGGREKSRPWAGEYFNLTLPVDGFSLYADARHERGSEAYYPKVTPAVVTGPGGVQVPADSVTLEQTKLEARRTYTLAVYGLKYDFEGGNTLRAEYVLNDAGYTKTDNAAANRAFDIKKNPQQLEMFQDNLEKSSATGLELPGQRYVFFSAYIPDFFTNDTVIYLRTLYSLTDKSASSYGSVEYSLKDAGTILASVAGSSGSNTDKRYGELKGFVSPSYTLGYKHLW